MTDEFVRSALPRYGRVPRGLLRDPDLSDRAVRVYGLLDDYAGADAMPFPKRSTLAAACGCSVDSIDRAIRELIDGDWMRKQPRHRDDGGNTSNLYILGSGPVEGGRTPAAPPAAPVRPQEGEPDEEEPPTSPTDDIPLIEVSPVGAVGHTGNMSNPTATASSRREVRDDDPGWATWWSLYPRKVGKGAARRKWLKALQLVGGDVEVLNEGARRVAREYEWRKSHPDPQDRGKDPIQFVPHPATWLHQERWADESRNQDSRTRGAMVPANKQDECPLHMGEHKDRCRMCAAERKGKG